MVGRVHDGDGFNVIPIQAKLTITIRTLSHPRFNFDEGAQPHYLL
ncbi:MAG: hypothetical protein SXV54_21145 [Chloroflexota bacterium]|nr:hypothetical protein [Chloroflexota bacterium]